MVFSEEGGWLLNEFQVVILLVAPATIQYPDDMKSKLRYYLFLPFSLLYGLVTYFRNKLFDEELLSGYTSVIPTILVGNLTVGGTGKTPHIEYLIELLRDKYRVAVLSRGYKRISKGFVLANPSSSVLDLGDEPYQLFTKFPDIILAVDADRVNGVKQLEQLLVPPDVILLDDAFQHRYIRCDLQILLTDKKRLYVDDSVLPGGLLREYKSGSKRADIIVVTKCDTASNEFFFENIRTRINPTSYQNLYFSSIQYASLKAVFNTDIEPLKLSELKGMQILLVTGIVNNKPIIETLQEHGAMLNCISYPDHHQFSVHNYAEIEREFVYLQNNKKLLVVTEKDAARIVKDASFPVTLKQYTFSLPISVKILENKKESFDNQILNYVAKNKRNS